MSARVLVEGSAGGGALQAFILLSDIALTDGVRSEKSSSTWSRDPGNRRHKIMWTSGVHVAGLLLGIEDIYAWGS